MSQKESDDEDYDPSNDKVVVRGKDTGGKAILIEKNTSNLGTPESEYSGKEDSSDDDQKEAYKPAEKKKPAKTKAKKEPKKKADKKNTKKGKKDQKVIEEDGQEEKKENPTKKINAKPTKNSKETKGAAGDMRETIIKYFKDNNKPYNSTTIYENLKKAYSKVQINKLLEKLAEEKILCDKGGKNNVYWYNQDLQECGDVEAAETELKELERNASEKEKTRQKQNSELNKLTSKPDDDELQKQINELMAKDSQLDQDINSLKNQVGGVSEKQLDKDKIFMDDFEKQFKILNKARNDRRFLFKDIFGMLLDGGEMKKNELLEELEIDFEYNS